MVLWFEKLFLVVIEEDIEVLEDDRLSRTVRISLFVEKISLIELQIEFSDVSIDYWS